MIEKCKYCGFYSNNINDNSLRDGYCFLEDVGNYCKRNENDYCSKFVFAGCKLHGQIELLKTELESKKREIENLEQENKREIKTINDLITENAKLIEWIQGILKASKICEVRDQVSTFTIPISKVEGNYGMEGSVEPFHQEDIFIPSIHFTTVDGNIWR